MYVIDCGVQKEQLEERRDTVVYGDSDMTNAASAILVLAGLKKTQRSRRSSAESRSPMNSFPTHDRLILVQIEALSTDLRANASARRRVDADDGSLGAKIAFSFPGFGICLQLQSLQVSSIIGEAKQFRSSRLPASLLAFGLCPLESQT